MAKIKTTILLNESLIKPADAIAEEMGISRSRLFSVAAEQFVMKHENQKILGVLNNVYRDGPSASEQRLLHEVKLKYQQMLKMSGSELLEQVGGSFWTNQYFESTDYAD